jgi:hypothetical protein
MTKKIAVVLIVLVLLGAVGGFIYKKMKPANAPITQTDFAMAHLAETRKALPEGFPLEPLNITEQKQIDYPEHKSSLYSVVYSSAKSSSELVGIYKTYLAGHGYAATTTMATSTGLAYIMSKKGNDDIAIAFSPLSGRTNVSISVVTRQ